MKRLIAVVLALATLTTLFAIPASAQTPYEGYNYNSWKQSVPAPTGYMPDDYFVGREYECGDFSNPQDIFIGDDDIVYVTDTGNSRIVKFDLEMNYLGVIDSFTKGEETITFKNPEGMYVSEDGSVFVADTGNGRVLIANPDLTLRSIITKPVNSDVYEQADELIPIKVFSDMAGIVYVLSRSNNKGILTFDEKGNFLAYYGTSRVKATAEVIAYYFWERFMSDEQRESAVTFTPVEYKSMTYGKDNFVYSTLFTSSWDNSGQLKKLNPKGIDVVKQRRRIVDTQADCAARSALGIGRSQLAIDVAVDLICGYRHAQPPCFAIGLRCRIAGFTYDLLIADSVCPLIELRVDSRSVVQPEMIEILREKAKNLPCVFNNWGAFYNGKFISVNQLDGAAVQKIIKKSK